MKTIRNSVFETNSSSMHCVSLLTKDEWLNGDNVYFWSINDNDLPFFAFSKKDDFIDYFEKDNVYSKLDLNRIWEIIENIRDKQVVSDFLQLLNDLEYDYEDQSHSFKLKKINEELNLDLKETDSTILFEECFFDLAINLWNDHDECKFVERNDLIAVSYYTYS